MIPRRLFPSLGPDHDFPSLGISVNRPLHFTDDLFGTLLRNAQNPSRIVRGHRPAVVDSDRLPHTLFISLRSNPGNLEVVAQLRQIRWVDGPWNPALRKVRERWGTGPERTTGGSQLLNSSMNFPRDVNMPSEETS
jgi:hypothetical protein